MLPVDVAKREANPMEGAFTVLQRWSGHVSEALCRGAKAHERMNPSSQDDGGRRAEKNREGSPETEKLDGRGEPDVPLDARIQHSEEPANPMRVSRRGGDIAAAPVWASILRRGER